MNPVSIRLEARLNREGYNSIAGVDEAGIGPLAGPVVAAAVILPDKRIKGIDDSKKLNSKKREEAFLNIIRSAVSIGVGIVDNPTIDRMNILRASLMAMTVAIKSLDVRPDHIMVDGIRKVPDIDIPQISVKHGDGISYSIAAASIIAKTIRDSIMGTYDILYPQYGFLLHKGYGTKEHMRTLKKHGTSPIHRISYAPVMSVLIKKGLLFI